MQSRTTCQPFVQSKCLWWQAPYLVYVEVLECANVNTAPVPSKLLENTLRHVRSEEDLAHYNTKPPAEGSSSGGGTGGSSPRPEFSVFGNHGADYDDADCWSQEDDEIIQVGEKVVQKKLPFIDTIHCSCPLVRWNTNPYVCVALNVKILSLSSNHCRCFLVNCTDILSSRYTYCSTVYLSLSLLKWAK